MRAGFTRTRETRLDTSVERMKNRRQEHPRKVTILFWGLHGFDIGAVLAKKYSPP
jgi:hypothetical protein